MNTKISSKKNLGSDFSTDKRENVMIDDEEYKSDDVSPPHLPEELILENILTRLSAKDLARFASVSKFWYNSIVNDTGFAMSHFARNQNRRNLSFDLFNLPKEEDVNADWSLRNCFFNLQKDNSNQHDSVFYDFELLSIFGLVGGVEPVGSCNGLACIKHPSDDRLKRIMVINPLKGESLTLTCLTPEIGGGGGSLEYLCHGFGFDSLSQVYKIVVIYTTSTTAGDHGFMCLIFTLGDTVWRKIVISTSDISPPPGCSSFPSQMATRMWDEYYRSATVCGDDLLWRISNNNIFDDEDENEMLLSFNIHNEKIQFIRLPTECNSLIHNLDSVVHEDKYHEISHHLMEFKGYPCVARSEKIWIGEGVDKPSYGEGFCYYHFKVHLYKLKDKVKQIWIEEEAFDVRMKEDGVKLDSLLRDPFDRYFNRTKDSHNHWSCTTRMFGFSDQVMLYWFDGGCLIFYNLGTEHHNVVKGNHSYNEQNRDIFKAKLTQMNPAIVGDDVPHCAPIDYQMHAQVENIVSLKTFIPKGGEVGEFDCCEEFRQFLPDKQPAGWVHVGRKSPKWYVFF